MDANITLKLDKHIIEMANAYAKKQGISVSKLIEKYLTMVTKEKVKKEQITPLVRDLIGVIQPQRDFNYKNEYSEYLTEKYK